jgi:hypothetical protein
MKANEAPEKIYLFENSINNILSYRGLSLSKRSDENDIEYTRTNAFIEKALKWYCLDCECNDNCKDTKCFFHNAYKRFLEGDKNACPPKFVCTILNPDGSTSDNWRYRHFIRKMQDAFIKKAVEWFEQNQHMYNTSECLGDRKEFIEDFKKAMKL